MLQQVISKTIAQIHTPDIELNNPLTLYLSNIITKARWYLPSSFLLRGVGGSDGSAACGFDSAGAPLRMTERAGFHLIHRKRSPFSS